MNNNKAILHYKFMNSYFKHEYRFDQIRYFVLDNEPTPEDGHMKYTMGVIIKGKSGKIQHATYVVSGYPPDRIIYEGREYRSEEFTDLYANIYYRNLEHDLEVLE